MKCYHDKNQELQKLVQYTNQYNLKSLVRWAGKSTTADATKMTAYLTGHMTYTQAPAVCEKKHFPLVSLSQWKITLCRCIA